MRELLQPAKRAGGAEAAEERPSLICAKDVALLSALPFMAALAWLLPDRLCLSLCRAAVRVFACLDRRRYQRFVRIVQPLLDGAGARRDADAIVESAIALRHLERLQLLRFYRPGGWQPVIRLQGAEHLDAALARGKGAILWVKRSAFSSIETKIAFHRAGYGLCCLSRHDHGGFSLSRFGVRFLNPIRTRIERRNMAEPIVIQYGETKPAKKRMLECLAENRVLHIVVGPLARRVNQIPIFRGTLGVGGGAPILAIRTGAALLPVFTERCPDGSFRVTVEPPLKVPDRRDPEAAMAELLRQYGAVLERYVMRVPEQYDAWDYLPSPAKTAAPVAELGAA